MSPAPQDPKRPLSEGMIPAPVKPAVTYADFSRLDIRVGTIQRVEEVPKGRSK